MRRDAMHCCDMHFPPPGLAERVASERQAASRKKDASLQPRFFSRLSVEV